MNKTEWAGSEPGAAGDDFERWLGARLRQVEPYLEDNGFTDRVMRQLPQIRPAGRPVSTGIILLTTVLSLIIVACNFPLLGLVIDAVVFLTLLNKLTLLGAGLLFALGLAFGGVWALKRDIF